VAEPPVGSPASMPFTINLSAPAPPNTVVNVKYATADGTAKAANGDYAALPLTTLTFNPGDTSKTIPVTVNRHNGVGPNGTFSFNLSAPTNATLADGSALGTIVSPGGPLSVSVADTSAAQPPPAATTTATFTVSLSAPAPPNTPVTVKYATADGTATLAKGDYTQVLLNTLTFFPGEQTKTVDVTVKDDGDAVPGPNEVFYLNLSAPTNATLADSQGMATIVKGTP
jgi:Calx-beta domain